MSFGNRQGEQGPDLKLFSCANCRLNVGAVKVDAFVKDNDKIYG